MCFLRADRMLKNKKYNLDELTRGLQRHVEEFRKSYTWWEKLRLDMSPYIDISSVTIEDIIWSGHDSKVTSYIKSMGGVDQDKHTKHGKILAEWCNRQK